MTDDTNIWENYTALNNKYYFIDHLEPQKRMRVWEEQQLNSIIEFLAPNNYLTEYVRFLKGCDNLAKSYPNHQEMGHIDAIRNKFMEQYNEKILHVIKPAIRRIYKAQAKKDLKRMGFL